MAAREVGGDYYDFLEIDQDTMGFVLGDVSGKGVPAALLMANLQACFRSQSQPVFGNHKSRRSPNQSGKRRSQRPSAHR